MRYPNVYLETSSSSSSSMEMAAKELPPEKLILAATGHSSTRGGRLYKIRLLKMPAENEAKVL